METYSSYGEKIRTITFLDFFLIYRLLQKKSQIFVENFENKKLIQQLFGPKRYKMTLEPPKQP